MRRGLLFLLALTAGRVVADNALILQPHAGEWRVGGYRDVAVLAVTESRPVGAARFDILLTNTQAVRCVAAFGNTVAAAGGLIPICDADPLIASDTTRVASFNAWRPDAPCGTSHVATLRFEVTGAPGDTCTIVLTNAALWSTAAFPTNETAAAAHCRELPVSGDAVALPVTVSGASGHGLSLAAIPSAWQQGRLYPVRVVADSQGELLSGFDATLSFPAGAVEVLDVSTLHRQQPVMWKREGGQLRMMGVQGSSLWQTPGTTDLATVWFGVRATPPEAGEALSLTHARLFAAPAPWAHGLPVSDTAVSVSRCAPPQQALLTAPPATNISLDSEFETPLAVDIPAWTPWLIGGRFTFDPARVTVLSMQPTGILAHAAFEMDTNTFASGCVPFTWSDFSRADEPTNATLDLMTVRWKVTGNTLQRGSILGELFLADGIWEGFDTAHTGTNFSFFIRFSPTDADGDGILDWWEIQHYGGETNAVAGSDTDRDGMTAWEEFFARTDPTNSASRLHMVGILGAESDEFAIRWASVSGVTYHVQVSTNLLHGFHALVADSIEATAPTNTYIHTNAPAVPQRFYRVGIQRP